MTRTALRRHDANFNLATSASAPGEVRIRAMVDGLSSVVADMERRWGVGRLRQLASDPLRMRFDEQRARVDAAVASGEERFVQIQTEAMRRAWETLERAAQESGAKPLSSEVWEVALPGKSEVIALVRSDADVAHVAAGRAVFTLSEIALLIEKLAPEAIETKRAFAGATITRLKTTEPFDWSKGDDVPF